MTVAVFRLVVLLVAVVLSAASGGAPAVQSSGPPPGRGTPWVAPGAGAPASVEDKGFTGTDGTDRINFYFRKAGVLHYRDPQGWWEDGRWQQAGANVTISLAEGFATYRGVLQGDLLSGEATNKNGKSWRFSVRQGTPRQPAQLDLVGSSWGGKEDKSCIVLHFRTNGALEYDTPSGRYADGFWEIDGEWVYLKHKNTGFEYFGSVKGGRMYGNLWSKDGQHWGWDVNKGVVPTGCGGAAGGGGGAPQPAAVATVEGTTWEGDNGGDATTLRFEKGGVLLAKDPQGDWKGTWFQNGGQVNFDLNGRYSWYEGKIDGKQMTGAGHNKDGLDWTFKLGKK